MNSLDWVHDAIKQSDGSYISVVCPLFVDRVCSIYEERPSCCRSFPQLTWYCSENPCAVTLSGTCGTEVESSPSCTECKTKCCESILVPKSMEPTKENILRLLDISCEDCRKIF